MRDGVDGLRSAASGLGERPQGPWRAEVAAAPVQVPPPYRRVCVLAGDVVAERLAALVGPGHLVQRAADAAMLLRRLDEGRFDVAVVEHGRGIGDALDLLDAAERQAVAAPIIVIGEPAPFAWRLQALDRGAALVLAREEATSARLGEAIDEAIARRRRAARLIRLSQRDDLTGLANRALFADRLRRAVAAARRRGAHLAVMVLDLNGFKAVNDRHGHAAGDTLLRVVGERLAAAVRETDTVARLGGDEFALVVEDLIRPEHAPLVAGKLLDALQRPIPLAGAGAEVSGSLGVAPFPRDSEEPETLLRLADAAMYRAKREGGNRCRFHDPAQDARADHLAGLRDDLRRMIDQGGLVLRFQPQLTLRRGLPGVVGHTVGHLADGRLLDETALRRAAEAAGLLDQLTEWSLAAACAQLRRWRQSGLRGMHLAVPILSQRQLRWSGLCERLGELVRQVGAAPRELEIEVDEQLLRDEVASGGRTLEGLQRLGVRLAVADFGRAGGALGLLREAGLSTVKVGPGLLEGIVEEPARYTLAVAVLRVARELGLRTVGAGVRSEEQLRLLRDEGADAVQDLLRAPPQPVEAATEWLAQAIRRV